VATEGEDDASSSFEIQDGSMGTVTEMLGISKLCDVYMYIFIYVLAVMICCSYVHGRCLQFDLLLQLPRAVLLISRAPFVY